MPDVVLRQLTKRFGKTTAVDSLDLECRDGEFFVLLGPSGAGKTTTLRLIAGLTEPTSGQILIGDRDVTQVEPGVRDVAMAFEAYALYPHLSVYENLAFPLRSPRSAGRYTGKALDDRVRTVARLLQIDELLDRAPTQLSGGQKQRVALGRALVREPAVFLLDEPIAHLDAKLRTLMHGELRRIQKEFGTTTLYATPDYAEAMAMADRLAIINLGRVVQVGAPLDVYDRPANEFVARFMGDPPMNFFDAEVVTVDDRPALRLGGHDIRVQDELLGKLSEFRARRLRIGVRPIDLAVALSPEMLGEGSLRSEVLVAEPSERTIIGTLRVNGGDFKVKVPADIHLTSGQPAFVRFDSAKFHLFDPNTGDAVLNGSTLSASRGR